jgi:hypothetical protein
MGAVTWPEEMTTTAFQKTILARPEEPSFETLAKYGLSMPVWAMMGLKDYSREQAVSWDGQIVAERCWIRFALGDPPRTLSEVPERPRRTLVDGWLPGVTVEGKIGDVEVRQTSFVAAADESGKSGGLFIVIELRNRGMRNLKGALRVEAFLPEKRGTLPALEFRDGMLVSGNTAYLAGVGRCRADKEKNVIAFDLDIPPDRTQVLRLVSPIADPSSDNARKLQSADFDAALKRLRSYWEKILAPATKLNLPEPRLNNLCRAVLIQLFINAHANVMPYGSTPSAYDGSLYGVEEGYAMTALAMFGFAADAERYMDGTYLTPAFLKKVEVYKQYEDRHQQYRNGLQPMYAIEVYRLTRDKAWIEKHLPLIRECAEWTIANRRKTMQLEGGKKPLHWGLLPKWSYGGDIADQQCYPLYSNFCCWKGLVETAWLLDELGDRETAARYRKEADDYYAVIMSVVDRIYRADAKPPVLPPHVYAQGADGGEYYQLFAGCILDLLPFRLDDKRANYLADFLEQDNRVFCLLPRFRRDAGPGGLDAIYGLGYILSKLHQDRIREFLLGFYAFQVFNMEHTCFTSRETNAIYATEEHLRTDFKVPAMSDPLPCSSAVALLFLRHLLVTEETLGAGEYTGGLKLLTAAPRKWFEQGKTIEVEGAPTHFGKVSFKVTSRAKDGIIEADVTAPDRGSCSALKLRLRHPQEKPFKTVLVNGKPHTGIDAKGEWVVITKPAGKYHVEARY